MANSREDEETCDADPGDEHVVRVRLNFEEYCAPRIFLIPTLGYLCNEECAKEFGEFVLEYQEEMRERNLDMQDLWNSFFFYKVQQQREAQQQLLWDAARRGGTYFNGGKISEH